MEMTLPEAPRDAQHPKSAVDSMELGSVAVGASRQGLVGGNVDARPAHGALVAPGARHLARAPHASRVEVTGRCVGYAIQALYSRPGGLGRSARPTSQPSLASGKLSKRGM